MDWNEYFFRHVYLAAQKSKDTKTKVGAILVKDNTCISEGYNGICRGVNDYNYEDGRNERPIKYFFYEHAERNCLYTCNRHGISTLGATMYIGGMPCADCARAIIQCGISKIVLHKQRPKFDHLEKWVESTKYSKIMLDEANIPIEIYDKQLGIEVFIDGKTLLV